MVYSPDSITLEHIDPINHHLICGLCNKSNEIFASGSYNFAKTNKFVPYRICSHVAPVTYGDIGEFLIDGVWVVTAFGGKEWHAETRRVGFASTKNRSFVTHPALHKRASSKGGKANKGTTWWYNPVTDHMVKTFHGCPGSGYENRMRRTSDRVKLSSEQI